MNFAELSATQLLQLPREQTVFLFPVGALEDHGPHLPLGLDLLEARGLAQALGARIESELPGWKAVLLPEAALSVDAQTSALALTQRPHVVRDHLVDSCLKLERAGFRHFVVVTGTLGPRQLSTLEDAGRLFHRRIRGFGLLSRLLGRGSAKATLVCAQSALVSRQEAFRSPLWPEAPEHGGARDTSVALHLAPALVGTGWQALGPLDRAARGLGHAWRLRSGQVSGYVGNPSQASAEKGRARLEADTDTLVPKLRAVWSGSNPDLVFRSWDSIFPPNRSFFKAWVLALALVTLIGAWVYLNVQVLTQ